MVHKVIHKSVFTASERWEGLESAFIKKSNNHLNKMLFDISNSVLFIMLTDWIFGGNENVVISTWRGFCLFVYNLIMTIVLSVFNETPPKKNKQTNSSTKSPRIIFQLILLGGRLYINFLFFKTKALKSIFSSLKRTNPKTFSPLLSR